MRDKPGFEPKQENSSALLAAIEVGDQGKIIELLAMGVDVNGKYEKGQTPLMLAIDSNDGSTFNMLLVSNADVNAVDNKGQTVLARAIRHANIKNNTDFTIELMAFGAK